jgi:predicted negative regulator of RcsB-dependent stress response
MLNTLQADPATAVDQARGVVAEFPSTTYSFFASLAMAEVAVAEGEPDRAAAHLRRVMGNAGEATLRQVARLRLGHVLVSQGQHDEALALAQGADAGSLAPAFEELKGDLYLAKGMRAEARTAYANALAGYTTSGKQELVRMKLVDLADAEEGQA